jgi:hypothetical protein
MGSLSPHLHLSLHTSFYSFPKIPFFQLKTPWPTEGRRKRMICSLTPLATPREMSPPALVGVTMRIHQRGCLQRRPTRPNPRAWSPRSVPTSEASSVPGLGARRTMTRRTTKAMMRMTTMMAAMRPSFHHRSAVASPSRYRVA